MGQAKRGAQMRANHLSVSREPALSWNHGRAVSQLTEAAHS